MVQKSESSAHRQGPSAITAPPPPCRVQNIFWWHLLVMPVTLEVIRTTEAFSHQRIELYSTFECPMFAKSKRAIFVGVGGDVALEEVFLFVCFFWRLFTCRCRLMLSGISQSWLQFWSWILPTSWRATIVNLRLSAGEILKGPFTSEFHQAAGIKTPSIPENARHQSSCALRVWH